MVVYDWQKVKRVEDAVNSAKDDLHQQSVYIIDNIEHLPYRFLTEQYNIQYRIFEAIRGFNQHFGLEGSPIPAGHNITLIEISGFVEIYQAMALMDWEYAVIEAKTSAGYDINRPYNSPHSAYRVLNEGSCILHHCLIKYDTTYDYYGIEFKYTLSELTRFNDTIDINVINEANSNDLNLYYVMYYASRSSTIFRFKDRSVRGKIYDEIVDILENKYGLTKRDYNIIAKLRSDIKSIGYEKEVIIHKDDNAKMIKEVEDLISAYVGGNSYSKEVIK